MICDGVTFHLVSVNVNVNDEGREGLDLDVPWFVEVCTGVGVGGRYRSGRKVEWRGRIVRIKQGCVSSRRSGDRSGTSVHSGDGLMAEE